MVAMPKKAIIHIQKMAPGPPVRMAPEAPTMLPVPTWAAMAVARAWKELMPPSCRPPARERFPNTFPMPSPKQRIWTKRVLMENQRPTAMRRPTRM